MRILFIAVTLLFSFLITACGSGNQINARNLKTANKSVNFIKERLQLDERIQYEVSYWTLRDEIKNNEEFLKAIDGKRPEELITIGKESFSRHKASGDAKYAQFESWEQMISQSAQQRNAQDKSSNTDPRDKRYPRVDYKLHSM